MDFWNININYNFVIFNSALILQFSLILYTGFFYVNQFYNLEFWIFETVFLILIAYFFVKFHLLKKSFQYFFIILLCLIDLCISFIIYILCVFIFYEPTIIINSLFSLIAIYYFGFFIGFFNFFEMQGNGKYYKNNKFSKDITDYRDNT